MTWTIEMLPCGSITGAESILFLGGDPKRTREIGCYAYLLTGHGERVLVDTGIRDLAAVNRTVRGSGAWRQKPEETMEHHLAVRGLAETDIDRLILTHWHYDHCSDLGRFSRARIYLGQAEWDRLPGIERRETPERAEALRVPAEALARAAGEGRVTLVDAPVAIAPGLLIEPVGGHTAGSQWVIAATSDGPFLVAGDAVFLEENLRRRWPIGRAEDPAAAVRALERARAYSGRLLTGHDPSGGRHFSGASHERI